MSKRIQKIEQLDSLRAVAAFIIILHHFIPDYQLGNFFFGSIGVDIFFVISGFLITSVLLEQKNVVHSRILIIKNFVIKRALRLFPTYYMIISLFLLLMLVFGLFAWGKGYGIFYYTYTQNILFFREGMQGKQLNHVWSLAVEEQFYLFWPWFVIYISNKNLIRLLVFVIPIALLFKSFSQIENLRMLPFYHFDTLGSGALFALLIKESRVFFLLLINKIKIPVIILTTGILIFNLFIKTPNLLFFTSITCLSISLVVGCYYKFTNIIGALFNLPSIKYLGVISYGLYLYHKPIPYFIDLILFKLHYQINHFILLILSLLLTFVIAHISYQFIEKPILRLKEKFDL